MIEGDARRRRRDAGRHRKFACIRIVPWFVVRWKAREAAEPGVDNNNNNKLGYRGGVGIALMKGAL